jgi:hypothetical protein
MEAVSYSEKSMNFYRTTRCNKPRGALFDGHDYLKPSEFSGRVISRIASSWVLNYESVTYARNDLMSQSP